MAPRQAESMTRTAALLVALLVFAQANADAAEITILCSNGLKAVMEELVPQFERATKHRVAIKYGLAAALKRQIDAGERFDVAVLTPPLVDELIKTGKIAGESRTVIARAGMGLAIRAGAAKPDVRTTDALTRTLTGSRSIAYAREGAAGVFFAGLIDRLGLADRLKPKLTPLTTGAEVGAAVARGDVELGVLPISEILPVKGVELLGPFPADIQGYAVMVAGVGSTATQTAAAKELIAFLMAPSALPVIRQKGMERQPESAQGPARSDQEVLIDLEQRWNQAFYRKDVAFIETILADEFVATYDDGSRGDRRKELTLAAEFNQNVESAIPDEFTVKIFRDTAVVWFTLNLVGIREGQRAEMKLRYTDVWVIRDGRWQCVSTHSTRVSTR
jgi:molybdate transport system substrate-binding protein